MDSRCDEEAHELHSSRRPKIIRSTSCTLSARSAAKSLSRFHGSCSTINQKPLIIHTFDPEIIVTEPGEFMWVVQRLTGSMETRRSLRASKRKRGEMQSMQAQDVQQENLPPLMLQSNEISLREVTARACTTGTAALMTGDSSNHFCIKDHIPSSPLPPNSNAICTNSDNPLVLPLSSDTFQFNNCKVSHPSPASSSNSAYSKEKFNYPSSPTACNNSKEPPQCLPSINPSILKINLPLTNPRNTLTNNSPSPLSLNPGNFNTNNDPLSPNVSCNYSGNSNHMSLPTIVKPTGMNKRDQQAPWSPLSPTSGLTAASSEDCHTDLSTESSTASPREPLPLAAGNEIQAVADEDESNFFVFSLDSYYGNNAAQDALEFNHSNFLVDSSYSSMTLTPCTEAFHLSCLKDLATWLPIMD